MFRQIGILRAGKENGAPKGAGSRHSQRSKTVSAEIIPTVTSKPQAKEILPLVRST